MPGVFLGDYVKGRLTGQRPKFIEVGIQFHRVVDAHVDSHDIQIQAVRRLPKPMQRYGGIICDVVFDHFLANQWHHFCDQDFADFCQMSYQTILTHEAHLDPRAKATITRMASNKSLEGYRSKAYVERSLAYISERLRHDNPLAQALPAVEKIEVALKQDFMQFMPSVQTFAADWLADHSAR